MTGAARARVIDWATASILGIGSLVVYLATLCPGAYPGQSARLITEHTGLFLQHTASHFLWTLLVRAVQAVPVGGLAWRVNVLSAACGALSVACLYALMAGTIRRIALQDDPKRPRAALAGWLAGTVSALFLAFCVPFWIASNRAHTASFDTLLLLLAALLFNLFAGGAPGWVALLLGLLYGAGMVESATMIVFAPLLALGLLLALWKREELRVGRVALILFCVLGGLSLYVSSARMFYGSPGYEARQYRGFFQIVWFVWREQYFLITRGLPRVGWLTVLFVGVAPWLAALMVGRRALNDERDRTYYILHALMTAVAVAVLLNQKMAPWPMLGERRLLVTPYVLTASLFGYLAAYWLLVPGTWWPAPETRAGLIARRWFGLAAAAAALAAVATAPLRNAAAADARPGELADRYAAAALEGIGDRPWAVTDGVVDDNLLIVAADRGRRLRLVNTAGADNEVYMRYLEGLLESQALKNLSRAGMVSMLREWFQADPRVAERVAVLWPADLWMAAGCAAAPNGLAFVGARDPKALDPADLLRRSRELWTVLVPALKSRVGAGETVTAYAQHLLGRASLAANNLGVLMEDLGRDADAWTAYRQARWVNPDNVSALLNQHSMVRRGYSGAGARQVAADVQRLVLGLRRKYRIWGLSRTDGYVRMPEAYVQLGMVWALSGQPGMAMAGLKQAMAMVPEERNSRVAQTIAGVYLDQGREKEGETIYRSALAKNPKATDALFGMARVLALQGKFDEAGAMLQRAEQAGAPHARVALAWAAVRLAAGEMGKARIALEELVELQPGLVPAWDMLADVLLAQADDPAIERLLERMKEVQGTELVRGFALARFCAGRNDQAGARRHGEDALRLAPGNVRVLVFVLDLDARQQRWDSAEKRAKRLLAVSPENAMAYHVLGSLHLMRGEHTLAEDFLRRSLALRENAETLNNLAWLLNERGAAADAEKAARRAIELDNKSPACWDTLGTILLRAGRLDEAGEALKRALEFAGAEPATLVHMAELQMRRGQTDRAAETLAALRLRQREMPQSDQKEVERLFREVERIRAAATPPGGGPRPGGAR